MSEHRDKIVDVLVMAHAATSRREAHDLVQQGDVALAYDGEAGKITDPEAMVSYGHGAVLVADKHRAWHWGGRSWLRVRSEEEERAADEYTQRESERADHPTSFLALKRAFLAGARWQGEQADVRA